MPASGATGPVVAESSLPLQPSHMADAVAELDAEELRPLPPIPFGTFDIDEALDEADADARLDAAGDDSPGAPR